MNKTKSQEYMNKLMKENRVLSPFASRYANSFDFIETEEEKRMLQSVLYDAELWGEVVK